MHSVASDRTATNSSGYGMVWVLCDVVWLWHSRDGSEWEWISDIVWLFHVLRPGSHNLPYVWVWFVDAFVVAWGDTRGHFPADFDCLQYISAASCSIQSANLKPHLCEVSLNVFHLVLHIFEPPSAEFSPHAPQPNLIRSGPESCKHDGNWQANWSN